MDESGKKLLWLYFKYFGDKLKNEMEFFDAVEEGKVKVASDLLVFVLQRISEDLKKELVEVYRRFVDEGGVEGLGGVVRGFYKGLSRKDKQEFHQLIREVGSERVMVVGEVGWYEEVDKFISRLVMKRPRAKEVEKREEQIKDHLSKLDEKLQDDKGVEKEKQKFLKEVKDKSLVVSSWLVREGVLGRGVGADKVAGLTLASWVFFGLRKGWPSDALEPPYTFLKGEIIKYKLEEYFQDPTGDLEKGIKSMLRWVDGLYEQVKDYLINAIIRKDRKYEWEKKGLEELITDYARLTRREVPEPVQKWLFELRNFAIDYRQTPGVLERKRVRRQVLEEHLKAQRESDDLMRELSRSVFEGREGEARELFSRMLGGEKVDWGMMGTFSPERMYRLLLEGSVASDEVRELHGFIRGFLKNNKDLRDRVEEIIRDKFSKPEAASVFDYEPFYITRALVELYDEMWVGRSFGEVDEDQFRRLEVVIRRIEQVFFEEIGRLMMVYVWGSGGVAESHTTSIQQIQAMILLLLLPAERQMAARGFLRLIQMKDRFLKMSVSEIKANRQFFDEREVNAMQKVWIEVGNGEGRREKVIFSDFLDAWEMWHYEALIPGSKFFDKGFKKYKITPKYIESYILSEDITEQKELEVRIARLVAESKGLEWGELSQAERSRLIFMARGSAAWMINTFVGFRVIMGLVDLPKDKVKFIRAFRFYLNKYAGLVGMGFGMEGISTPESRELKGKVPIFEELATILVPGDPKENPQVKKGRDTVLRALKHLFFEETQKDNPVLRPIGDVRAFGLGGVGPLKDIYESLWVDREHRPTEMRRMTGFFDDPKMRDDLLFLMEKLHEKLNSANQDEVDQVKEIFRRMGVDDELVNQIRGKMDGGVNPVWSEEQEWERTAPPGFDKREALAYLRAMMARWSHKWVGTKKIDDELGYMVEFKFNTYYDFLRYAEAIEKVSVQLFNFAERPTKSALLEIFGILKGTTLGADVVRQFMKPLVDEFIKWHKGYKLMAWPWSRHMKIDWNMRVKMPIGGLIDEETGLVQYETGEIAAIDPLTGMPVTEEVTLRDVFNARMKWEDKLSAYKRLLPFVTEGMSLMQVLHGPAWGDDKYVLSKKDIMELLDDFRGKGMLDGDMVRELAFKHVGRWYYFTYRLGMSWMGDWDELLKMTVLVGAVLGGGVLKDSLQPVK